MESISQIKPSDVISLYFTHLLFELNRKENQDNSNEEDGNSSSSFSSLSLSSSSFSFQLFSFLSSNLLNTNKKNIKINILLKKIFILLNKNQQLFKYFYTNCLNFIYNFNNFFHFLNNLYNYFILDDNNDNNINTNVNSIYTKRKDQDTIINNNNKLEKIEETEEDIKNRLKNVNYNSLYGPSLCLSSSLYGIIIKKFYYIFKSLNINEKIFFYHKIRNYVLEFNNNFSSFYNNSNSEAGTSSNTSSYISFSSSPSSMDDFYLNHLDSDSDSDSDSDEEDSDEEEENIQYQEDEEAELEELDDDELVDEEDEEDEDRISPKNPLVENFINKLEYLQEYGDMKQIENHIHKFFDDMTGDPLIAPPSSSTSSASSSAAFIASASSSNPSVSIRNNLQNVFLSQSGRNTSYHPTLSTSSSSSANNADPSNPNSVFKLPLSSKKLLSYNINPLQQQYAMMTYAITHINNAATPHNKSSSNKSQESTNLTTSKHYNFILAYKSIEESLKISHQKDDHYSVIKNLLLYYKLYHIELTSSTYNNNEINFINLLELLLRCINKSYYFSYYDLFIESLLIFNYVILKFINKNYKNQLFLCQFSSIYSNTSSSSSSGPSSSIASPTLQQLLNNWNFTKLNTLINLIQHGELSLVYSYFFSNKLNFLDNSKDTSPSNPHNNGSNNAGNNGETTGTSNSSSTTSIPPPSLTENYMLTSFYSMNFLTTLNKMKFEVILSEIYLKNSTIQYNFDTILPFLIYHSSSLLELTSSLSSSTSNEGSISCSYSSISSFFLFLNKLFLLKINNLLTNFLNEYSFYLQQYHEILFNNNEKKSKNKEKNENYEIYKKNLFEYLNNKLSIKLIELYSLYNKLIEKILDRNYEERKKRKLNEKNRKRNLKKQEKKDRNEDYSEKYNNNSNSNNQNNKNLKNLLKKKFLLLKNFFILLILLTKKNYFQIIFILNQNFNYFYYPKFFLLPSYITNVSSFSSTSNDSKIGSEHFPTPDSSSSSSSSDLLEAHFLNDFSMILNQNNNDKYLVNSYDFLRIFLFHYLLSLKFNEIEKEKVKRIFISFCIENSFLSLQDESLFQWIFLYF